MPFLNINKEDRVTFLMVVVFLLLFFLVCFCSQKIHVNNGVGWDGLNYAQIIKDYPNYLHHFSSYYSLRVLPSFIVGIGLKLFGLTNSDANIIYGYEILNFLSIFFAIILWWRFSIRLKINTNWRVISFCFLFVNFPILKLTGFYPVLTDTLAFSLGVGLFYFYFINRTALIYILGLLASFTFPTFGLVTFLLLLFPNQQSIDSDDIHIFDKKLNWGAFLSACILIIMTFLLFITVQGLPDIIFGPILKRVSQYFLPFLSSFDLSLIPINLIYLNMPLLIISLLCMFFYTYFGLKYLSFPKWLLKNFFEKISFRQIVLALSFLLIKYFFFSTLSNGQRPELSQFNYLLLILKEFSALPLINIVSAFVYYGPLICVVILFWKKICEQALRSGLGCVLSLMLFLMISFDSESRHYINFIGMLVFLMLLHIKNSQAQLTKSYLALFVLSSLLLSKFWLQINIPNTIPESGLIYLSKNWQSYFMNFGPWMSFSNYILGLILCLFMMLFISLILRSQNNRTLISLSRVHASANE